VTELDDNLEEDKLTSQTDSADFEQKSKPKVLKREVLSMKQRLILEESKK